MSASSPAPRLALHLQNFAPNGSEGWGPLLDRARAADVAGIDRVLVSDHIVLGENLQAYARPEVGGLDGGRQPTGPDGHWLEPLTVLAVVSGITTNVRLGTNVLLAALRRPVVLAKTTATLDVLSGGRLDLGVGVGWQREEYEAAGVPFEGRGSRLDQTLGVCEALWAAGSASFDDGDIFFEAIHCVPKPLQAGGIPVWVSGRINQRVIARIVRFGSGWIPWGDDAIDPLPGIARLRKALDDAGRDPDELCVLGTLPSITDASGHPDLAATDDRIATMATEGVTDFRVNWSVPPGLTQATEVLTELTQTFRRTFAGTA